MLQKTLFKEMKRIYPDGINQVGLNTYIYISN